MKLFVILISVAFSQSLLSAPSNTLEYSKSDFSKHHRTVEDKEDPVYEFQDAFRLADQDQDYREQVNSFTEVYKQPDKIEAGKEYLSILSRMQKSARAEVSKPLIELLNSDHYQNDAEAKAIISEKLSQISKADTYAKITIDNKVDFTKGHYDYDTSLASFGIVILDKSAIVTNSGYGASIHYIHEMNAMILSIANDFLVEVRAELNELKNFRRSEQNARELEGILDNNSRELLGMINDGGRHLESKESSYSNFDAGVVTNSSVNLE